MSAPDFGDARLVAAKWGDFVTPSGYRARVPSRFDSWCFATDNKRAVKKFQDAISI
jgi:hypothetical protein